MTAHGGAAAPPGSMRRPEVLAPAGDLESMRAAVRAGADAVYFGLHGHNARARAANFEEGALEETMRFLHAHGVRGYVALNTLVFDRELEQVERAIRACARSGVDAVIVQDLGVARLARAIAPELDLHASTQMTCTDTGSVELARELGAQRVILARELSLVEIAAIRAEVPDVELEVFVHGALCIAYSGQCLTSEAIGGRSANRGACAQACRLPYELIVDGERRDLGDRAHLLSPEDLESASLVPELARLGIASLKIEGRLKGPAYIAATTRLYRSAIAAALGEPLDGALEDLRNDALQAYSRGAGPGFLAGVDHQRLVEARGCDHRGLAAGTLIGIAPSRGQDRLLIEGAPHSIAKGDGILIEGGHAGSGEIGGRVWDVVPGGDDRVEVWLGPELDVRAAVAGRRVWKTSDPAREKATLARIERDPARVAIDMTISGAIGEAPILAATSARGHSASVICDAILERATQRPLEAERVREQLARLGGSPFVLRALRVELAEGSILPISSLNRARRALTEALEASLHRARPSTASRTSDLLASAAPLPAPAPAGLRVLCRTSEQALAAIAAGADGVMLDFLELVGTGDALRGIRAAHPNAEITLAPPRIRKPGEDKIDRFLRALAPDALLVRGLGALREASRALDGIPRIGDFSLNVANRIAAREVLSRGLCAFTPSFDLDATQLAELLDRELAPLAEVVLHHPMPLFHMEHCVIAALLSDGKDFRSCGRPCERHQIALRDRAGMDHPIEADVGCRNTVFHARAQSAADLVPRLRERGVRRFRIELVRERAHEVARLVAAYRALIAGRASARETMRELRTEGGYGVVRGSLRVL